MSEIKVIHRSMATKMAGIGFCLSLLGIVFTAFACTASRVSIFVREPLPHSVSWVRLQCSSPLVCQAFADELRRRKYEVIEGAETTDQKLEGAAKPVISIDSDTVDCAHVKGSWSNPNEPVQTCVVAIQAQLSMPGSHKPIFSGVVSKRGGDSINRYAREVANETLDQMGLR
jgi:hypothetical protein